MQPIVMMGHDDMGWVVFTLNSPLQMTVDPSINTTNFRLQESFYVYDWRCSNIVTVDPNPRNPKGNANVANYFNKLPLCVKSTLVFFNNNFALKHIFQKMVRESHMIGNQVWDL
jgi:hypothetical protein